MGIRSLCCNNDMVLGEAKTVMPKHMVMTMVNKATMESFFFICVCTLYYQC